MSSVNELKESIDISTTKLVVLSILSAGVYTLIWIAKNYLAIDEATKQKSADSNFIAFLAVTLGLSFVLTGTGDETVEGVAALLTIAWTIGVIYWAFKVKSALTEYALNTHKVDLKMNVVWTLIFNVYYINYCINDLPELKRKQNVLSGESA